MDKDPKPERKKIPMKTRLIIIVITFVIVNLIFYAVFDGSDESTEDEEIKQESEVMPEESEEPEEKEYAIFNPPSP